MSNSISYPDRESMGSTSTGHSKGRRRVRTFGIGAATAATYSRSIGTSTATQALSVSPGAEIENSPRRSDALTDTADGETVRPTPIPFRNASFKTQCLIKASARDRPLNARIRSLSSLVSAVSASSATSASRSMRSMSTPISNPNVMPMRTKRPL